MKTVRLALASVITLIVCGGYVVSQIMYLNGPEAVTNFEAKVNQPTIHALMLVVFLGAIAIGFIPDREADTR